MVDAVNTRKKTMICSFRLSTLAGQKRFSRGLSPSTTNRKGNSAETGRWVRLMKDDWEI